MTDFLIRKFIKNSHDIGDVKVREAYGKLSGGMGILVNMILCGVKLLIGLMSGSIAIIGDAVHNLADAGASVVTMLGMMMSSKPADREHPYGHGRIEYVAGLIISGAIILIGVELMKSSIDKLMYPEAMASSWLTISILTVSVCLQLWLGMFNRGLGRRIDSPAMLAAATDSLSDCVATVVVIGCQVLHLYSGMDLDGATGIIVALFILHSGWGAARDTLQPILGTPADQAFTRRLRKLVLEDSQVLGIHDLIIHNYGPGRIFASLHIELPSSLTLMEAHNIAEVLEDKLEEEMQVQVTVHVDPVVTDDPQQDALKEMAVRVLAAIEPRITIHDFHLVDAYKLNFDVCVPYSCDLSNKEIRSMIIADLHKVMPEYEIALHVDRG